MSTVVQTLDDKEGTGNVSASAQEGQVNKGQKLIPHQKLHHGARYSQGAIQPKPNSMDRSQTNRGKPLQLNSSGISLNQQERFKNESSNKQKNNYKRYISNLHQTQANLT